MKGKSRLTCALVIIAAWQFTARPALAMDDARALHDAAHLYDLALGESARSIDGAVERLRRAQSVLAAVRGTREAAATRRRLAARIARAIHVLTERHRDLRERHEKAKALFNDHRPAAAWVLLDRLPTCGARDLEHRTLDVRPDRDEHCWPTADPHLDIGELQRNALELALTAERLVDEADGAARMCGAAPHAIRTYVTALTIDADLASHVDPKIARARACLTRPAPRSPLPRSAWRRRHRQPHPAAAVPTALLPPIDPPDRRATHRWRVRRQLPLPLGADPSHHHLPLSRVEINSSDACALCARRFRPPRRAGPLTVVTRHSYAIVRPPPPWRRHHPRVAPYMARPRVYEIHRRRPLTSGRPVERLPRKR